MKVRITIDGPIPRFFEKMTKEMGEEGKWQLVFEAEDVEVTPS